MKILGGINVAKNNCFAFSNKKCIALNQMYCRKGECNFYKTKSEYKNNILKSNEMLNKLPAIQLRYIIDKYPVLKNQLLEVHL